MTLSKAFSASRRNTRKDLRALAKLLEKKRIAFIRSGHAAGEESGKSVTFLLFL